MQLPDGAEEIQMATCEVCGNDYELSFEVVAAGFFCCGHCARAAAGAS